MPELPEVETTRQGLAPHLEGQRLNRIIVRQRRLRWPVPDDLSTKLDQSRLLRISRRAKYLLFHFETGVMLVHLGMSGSLRIVSNNNEAGKHDHIDFIFGNRQTILRLTDPRRFGTVLWLGKAPDTHPLLNKLGPEPLDDAFTGNGLYRRSRNRTIAVKQFIMDQTIVTGIGNIYANEALFKAGIRPTRAAGKISPQRYQKLVQAIKITLRAAIRQGGTTLRDFVGGDGRPGYFKQQLNVYGRSGLPCPNCGAPLREIKQSGRTTIFCAHCQR